MKLYLAFLAQVDKSLLLVARTKVLTRRRTLMKILKIGMQQMVNLINGITAQVMKKKKKIRRRLLTKLQQKMMRSLLTMLQLTEAVHFHLMQKTITLMMTRMTREIQMTNLVMQHQAMQHQVMQHQVMNQMMMTLSLYIMQLFVHKQKRKHLWTSRKGKHFPIINFL